MSRVFSKGPAPAPAKTEMKEEGRPSAIKEATRAGDAKADVPSSLSVAPADSSKSSYVPAKNVSTQDLIDELMAIAGNDGERVNTIEGRETASEYSRRVKASIAERESQEKDSLDKVLEVANDLDFSTTAGCSSAARLLCSALADGVLTNSLALASIVATQLFKSIPPPLVPAASASSSPLSEEATAHELECFRALESAAQAFLFAQKDDAHATRVRSCLIMWLAAIFLNVFVSANWTGPPLKDLALSPLPWHKNMKAGRSTMVEKAHRAAGEGESAAGGDENSASGSGCDKVEAALELASKQALEEDSEMFYRGAVAPMYLPLLPLLCY